MKAGQQSNLVQSDRVSVSPMQNCGAYCHVDESHYDSESDRHEECDQDMDVTSIEKLKKIAAQKSMKA